MILERGRVVAVEGGCVLVELAAGPHCGSCPCGCSEGRDGMRTVRIENTLDAVPGDSVTFAVGEKGIVASSILVYLLPILLLFAGVFAGYLAGGALSLAGELPAFAGGALGLLLSFAVVRTVSRLLAGKRGFLPVLADKYMESGTAKPSA